MICGPNALAADGLKIGNQAGERALEESGPARTQRR
jgi:hypothetical protein